MLFRSAIAEFFSISKAWARRLKQRRRETGETAARPMGGAKVVKIDRVRLAELVRAQPDATLEELRVRLGGVRSISAVCMALKRLGLSYKKRRSTRRSRTAPMWPGDGPPGERTSPSSTRAG